MVLAPTPLIIGLENHELLHVQGPWTEASPKPNNLFGQRPPVQAEATPTQGTPYMPTSHTGQATPYMQLLIQAKPF